MHTFVFVLLSVQPRSNCSYQQRIIVLTLTLSCNYQIWFLCNLPLECWTCSRFKLSNIAQNAERQRWKATLIFGEVFFLGKRIASVQSALSWSIFVLVLVAEIPFNFSHYRYRFSMPQLEWPMALNRTWYSFDIASVHFIRLVVIHD